MYKKRLERNQNKEYENTLMPQQNKS